MANQFIYRYLFLLSHFFLWCLPPPPQQTADRSFSRILVVYHLQKYTEITADNQNIQKLLLTLLLFHTCKISLKHLQFLTSLNWWRVFMKINNKNEYNLQQQLFFFFVDQLFVFNNLTYNNKLWHKSVIAILKIEKQKKQIS